MNIKSMNELDYLFQFLVYSHKIFIEGVDYYSQVLPRKITFLLGNQLERLNFLFNSRNT